MGLKGPMFVIAGEKDNIVSPQLITALVYEPAKVPTVYGTLLGADHFTPVGSAGPMRGYLTAWFRAHLLGDTVAKAKFFGPSCGICNDPSWKVKRKNL